MTGVFGHLQHDNAPQVERRMAAGDCPEGRVRVSASDLTESARKAVGADGQLDPSLGGKAAALLRDMAARDLSLGRLLEGHVNSVALIRAWASPGLRDDCARAICHGHLFGVWGADDAPAV